jgi:predicted RNA-binding protein with PUA-like domain
MSPGMPKAAPVGKPKAAPVGKPKAQLAAKRKPEPARQPKPVPVGKPKAQPAAKPVAQGKKPGAAAHWLVKSEPDAFSWDQQVANGTEPWTGVRNAQAANNLKAMRVGDLAFFYHSNVGKEIVGIVRVAREAYPDPSDETGRWVCVDMAAVEPLKTPVTLAEIKATPALAEISLIRQSRLSVMPIAPEHWALLRKMGGLQR